MPLRTRGRPGILCLAAALPLLAACTSDDTDDRRAVAGSHPSPRTTARSAQEPPELDAGETVAGRRGATSGNADVPYASGGKGDALIVAVRCEGEGTVKVSVSSVHVSFPQKCLPGEVSTTYNQVAVSGADRGGTVAVEAPSPVRWSLTVGRGAPAQEEPPATG
ncbi:hypothetical protein [Streptomyces griseosporeus]